MGTLAFDYYYGKESEQFTFYRIPRVLIKDKRFAGLSSDAKLLYGLLLDRMSLSQCNGWFDEDNRVYIIYTVQEIREDLCCGKDKAVKTMAELDSVKGIGLVEKKRRGLGLPDILYVKNFVTDDPDSCDSIQERYDEANSKNDDAIDSRQESQSIQQMTVAEANGIKPDVRLMSSDGTRSSDKPNSRSRECRLQEVGDTEFKKSEIPTSGGLKFRLQEVGISDPNYTKGNYTDNSHIKSIYPDTEDADVYASVPVRYAESVTRRDGLDGIDTVNCDTGNAAANEANAVTALIRENIDYDHHMLYDSPSDRERYDELYQVIVDAVLGRRDSVRIGDGIYPYDVVQSRLLKLTGEHLMYVRDCITEHTGEIRNMKKYMLAALYNAPATMGTYYTQMVTHDMKGGGWKENGVV